MSSDDVVIRVRNLGKRYPVYSSPRDRLKQFVLPTVCRLLRLPHGQYYQEFVALDDVSFEIKKGETIGIVGRNGSGKSTLLQMVCGTLSPSSGSIEINGRVAALLELGSGFNPEFTGRENIYLNATVLGLTKKEIDERFDDIVAFADIGDFIEQPIKSYSSGMVVRLAFAVIAHVDADILVIDEALSVGDAFFVQKCMRYLREFMEHGTVLFVSHDTSAVLNLCERALWLNKGKVVEEGDPGEVISAYLEKLYEKDGNNRSAQPARRMVDTQGKDAPRRDMRLDFINQSPYRNDIELFEFKPDADDFGVGGATIVDVNFLDEAGNRLSWVVGGERVQIVIECEAHAGIHGPIIGFTVKDRLGQHLFVDNTYLSYADQPLNVAAGSRFEGCFTFTMPVLPAGNYVISAAIAEGTQDEHVQHHWLHDALAFTVHASSVCMGLIGLPMEKIELRQNGGAHHA